MLFGLFPRYTIPPEKGESGPPPDPRQRKLEKKLIVFRVVIGGILAAGLYESGLPWIISLVLAFLVILAQTYQFNEWSKLAFNRRPEVRDADSSLIEAIADPEKLRRDRDSALAAMKKSMENAQAGSPQPKTEIPKALRDLGKR